MVASKEAGLGFEEKNVQILVLLALASVFERAWVFLEGFESLVVPRLGQACDIAIGAKKTHKFMLMRLLLARGWFACTCRIWLLLDKDCL